jgi:hypothetical protein
MQALKICYLIFYNWWVKKKLLTVLDWLNIWKGDILSRLIDPQSSKITGAKWLLYTICLLPSLEWIDGTWTSLILCTFIIKVGQFNISSFFHKTGISLKLYPGEWYCKGWDTSIVCPQKHLESCFITIRRLRTDIISCSTRILVLRHDIRKGGGSVKWISSSKGYY